MELSVRKAGVRDTEDIHRWRNHPPSRAMYLNTEEIALDSHRHWFLDSLDNPRRHMYIGEVGAEKIGICRFDIGADPDIAEAFLTLNPAMCGRGLSGAFLRTAIAAFLGSGAPARRFWAKIRVGNIPSIKCFASAGFMPADGDGDWNFYTFRAGADVA